MTINKAIILAAGRGTRLKPLSDTLPKPLTEVHGIPILRNALGHLERAGIAETRIVVGHLHREITDAFGQSFGKMKLSYTLNRAYSETNNAASLWEARDYISGGFLLLEADIFFEYAVLEKLIWQEGSAWAADYFTPAMNGCCLRADSSGRIRQLEIVQRSATVPPGSYKSAGMLSIDACLAERFQRWLGEDIEADRNVFFDLVLGRRLDQAEIRICCVHGLRWAEIDDLADLAEAERIFRP